MDVGKGLQVGELRPPVLLPKKQHNFPQPTRGSLSTLPTQTPMMRGRLAAGARAELIPGSLSSVLPHTLRTGSPGERQGRQLVERASEHAQPLPFPAPHFPSPPPAFVPWSGYPHPTALEKPQVLV